MAKKRAKQSKPSIEGKPLLVAATIGDEYSKAISSLINQMHKDIIRGVKVFGETYAQDGNGIGYIFPEGGKPVSQIRIWINKLIERYASLFGMLSERATNRMIDRVLKNSEITLKSSLKAMIGEGNSLSIKGAFDTPAVQEIARASAEESVLLIKSIPEYYLKDVQAALLRSISGGGNGVADLVPFLERYYKKSKRKLHLTALDQTRKLYTNINTQRMKDAGITQFKWMHSGGGREPRQLHVGMSGKVYNISDPPYIGDMYGQRVYGFPSQLPNCRCFMSPVINFDSDYKYL